MGGGAETSPAGVERCFGGRPVVGIGFLVGKLEEFVRKTHVGGGEVRIGERARVGALIPSQSIEAGGDVHGTPVPVAAFELEEDW